MTTPYLSVALVLTVLGAPTPDRDLDQLTKSIARQHLAYAAALAADSIRYGDESYAWIAEAIDDECEINTQATEGLTPLQIRQIDRFAAELCKSNQVWVEALVESETSTEQIEEIPSIFIEHTSIYLSLLSDGLRTSDVALERFNVMALMVELLGAHIMTEIPESTIVEWYSGALHEFLNSSTPGDATTIAIHLQRSWVGLLPQFATEFQYYANATNGLSSGERSTLLSLCKKRFDDSENQ